MSALQAARLAEIEAFCALIVEPYSELLKQAWIEASDRLQTAKAAAR